MSLGPASPCCGLNGVSTTQGFYRKLLPQRPPSPEPHTTQNHTDWEMTSGASHDPGQVSLRGPRTWPCLPVFLCTSPHLPGTVATGTPLSPHYSLGQGGSDCHNPSLAGHSATQGEARRPCLGHSGQYTRDRASVRSGVAGPLCSGPRPCFLSR